MYEDLKQKLEGCVYTVFTPFDEKDNIDYESLEKYLTHLYRGGARKFYVMAYNSRYSQLNNQEILQLNDFCIKKIKKLDPENLVIVGDPIHCSTKESIEFTKHAKDAGADLISLIFREKFFEDEHVLEHFSEIGNATNMPILVHEMAFLSGKNGKQMHWPVSLLKKLPMVPQIAALKEDAHDFETTCLALELEPQIRIVIAGRKSTLMQYKRYGAKSYLNGISMVDARIGEKFWQAWKNNDETIMRFIIEKLEAPFFDTCVTKYGWHRTNKALLQSAGFMHRRDRMPLKEISEVEYQEVVDVNTKLQELIKELFH